jgi:hypothetical protein
MNRITATQLHTLAAAINRETGSPMTYWADGKPSGTAGGAISVGHYCIDSGYGGYSLSRISNAQGGESNVLSIGKLPARELYDLMHAFLAGYRAAQSQRQQVAA